MNVCILPWASQINELFCINQPKGGARIASKGHQVYTLSNLFNLKFLATEVDMYKFAISFFVALLCSQVASAQSVPMKPGVTYNSIGNSTFGSDGTTYNSIGNSTFGSDGTTYNRVGNSTFGSDGTSYNRVGNSTFGSDGSTSTTIGNTTFGSDGTTCTTVGTSTFCN